LVLTVGILINNIHGQEFPTTGTHNMGGAVQPTQGNRHGNVIIFLMNRQ
jgi:hypothetical protein